MRGLSVVLLIFIAMMCFAISGNDSGNKETDTTKYNEGNVIFPMGDRGPEEWFTGTVWVTTLVNPTDSLRYIIGDVKFEAGARTHWHTHPIEQILLCTDGKGYYKEKEKPVRVLKKGDVVVIPPYVEHWHGATPNGCFTHIAVTNYRDGKNVEWMQPVTDEEYSNLK